MYQRTILPNGIRIVCETIPHVHSVSLGIWVGSGSRYEDPTYNGVSHFCEHMFFKGTAKRNSRQIAEEIDAVGGQLNAFTTKEYTCYYAKVLGQHFQFGVDLLSDMITNSTFAAAEISKEKKVILEEIKSFEDSPDEIIHDILAAAVLKGHPLGWTILGTPETVGRIDRDILTDYLKQHYTPDNITFALAGNVQFDQIVPVVADHFAGLQGRLEQTLPPIPEPVPDTIIKIKKTEQVQLCIGSRGFHRKSPNKYAALILDSILGGSVSSRLFQELREERGLVYSTGSSHASYKDTGIFTIYAGTSIKNFEQVVGVIKAEVNKLKQEEVEAVELSRAKEQLKGNLLLSLENTCNRMSRIAKTELFNDQLLTPEESVAKIDAVTSAEVLQVAKELFQDEKMILAAIGPFPANSKVMGKPYYAY